MIVHVLQYVPDRLKTFALVSGIVAAAACSTGGAGLASTDPSIDLSLAQYTEECQRAARQYMYELDFVMDLMDAGVRGPRLDRHVDLMWHFYGITVYDCGIDVSGWGDEHP